MPCTVCCVHCSRGTAWPTANVCPSASEQVNPAMHHHSFCEFRVIMVTPAAGPTSSPTSILQQPACLHCKAEILEQLGQFKVEKYFYFVKKYQLDVIWSIIIAFNFKSTPDTNTDNPPSKQRMTCKINTHTAHNHMCIVKYAYHLKTITTHSNKHLWTRKRHCNSFHLILSPKQQTVFQIH